MPRSKSIFQITAALAGTALWQDPNRQCPNSQCPSTIRLPAHRSSWSEWSHAHRKMAPMSDCFVSEGSGVSIKATWNCYWYLYGINDCRSAHGLCGPSVGCCILTCEYDSWVDVRVWHVGGCFQSFSILNFTAEEYLTSWQTNWPGFRAQSKLMYCW